MNEYFTESLIKSCLSSGCTLARDGIVYRVVKMSYGDFFLEPGIEHGENLPFNKGTLCLQRIQITIDNVKQMVYKITDAI